MRQGKVRYIGCSTLPAWQVVEAQWTSKHLGLHHFISCQEEYSLLARGLDSEMMPMLEPYGLGLIPFRPLADGLLTGKYERGMPPPAGTRLATMARAADRNFTDENWAIVERLAGFAAERGHTLLELAFSWLLRRPAVASVIAGATKPEQVEQNVRATVWALTPQEMQEIDRQRADLGQPRRPDGLHQSAVAGRRAAQRAGRIRCTSGSSSATRSCAAIKREGANVSLDDFIAQAGRGVPMGRMGRAEEFANIACFLASDAASYVTGCAINVDGGRSPVV